jgi:hypothetical protein
MVLDIRKEQHFFYICVEFTEAVWRVCEIYSYPSSGDETNGFLDLSSEHRIRKCSMK